MAYTVGEAAVQVTPYFDQFHNKIKSAVEKENKQHEVKVEVEAETRDFYAEMEAVEKRADELDGKRVNIYVDVDDSEATRKLNSFRDISRDPINFTTEVDGESLRNSSRQIDDFRDAHGDMDMFMRFNRDMADMEMDDFFKKYEGRGLKITPQIDPRFMEDLAKRSSGIPGGVSAERGSKRGSKDVDLESSYGDWDTLNHLPKFLEKMNLQVAIGLKQMGDAYFTTAEKMYRAMGRPYNRMKNMVYEANTLNDLFRRIARSPLGRMTSEMRGWAKHAYDYRKVISEVFTRDLGRASRSVKSFAQRSLGSIGDKADELTKKMRRFLQHVPGGEILVGLTAGAKEATGKVGNFFRAWGEGLAEGWNGGINRIKRTSTSLAGFIGNLTSRFSKFDVGFTDKLTGGLGKAAGKAKELGTTISSTIPKGAEAVSNFFRNKIPDSIAEISPRLYHAFAHLKEIDFLGIQAGFQRVGDAARKVGSSISEGWNSWLDNSRIARHFRTIGNVANEQFTKMRGAFSRFNKFFSKGFKGMGDTTRRRLGAIGGRFKNTFSRVGGVVGNGMKRVGGIIGKGLGAAGRMIGGNSAIFRGFRAIFGRVGNMAMGATRIMAGAFFKVGGVMLKAVMPALIAIIAGIGVLGGQALIGGILALGGAIGAVAVGAMLMAPGLIAAAGVSFVALKLGLEGVGNAVKSAFQAETVEDFEEAIADSRPVVQELARSFRAFKPAIDEMKNSVQDNLLGGLSDGVTSMMDNLLPTFSSGLQGIATEWNGAIKLALDELSSTRAQTGLGAIMEGTRDMAREMQPVMANLVAAFGSLGEQAAKFFGPFGKYLADASESFKNWAEGLKRINPATGLSEFDEKIEKMKVNAGLLSDIFGGLFGTIGNVFAAGAEGGGGMLAGMAESMQNLKNYTEEGSKGFNQIVGFMERATEASRAFGQIIGPIFDIIVSVGSVLAGVATGAIPGLGTALEGLAGGLQPLMDSAKEFGTLIGDALGAFAPVLEKLGGVLEPVLMGLAEGVNAMLAPLAGALDPIMDGLMTFAEAARPVLEIVGESFGKIFEALGPVIGSFLEHISAFLPVFGTLAGFLGETIAMIVDALAPIIDMMAPTMEKLAESLGGMFEQIFPALQEVIQALMPILPIVAEAFFSILDAILPLLPVLGEIVGTLLVAFADLLVMLTPLLPPLADLIGTVAKVLGEFLVDALEVILDIWNAIWPVLLATFQFLFEIIIIPLITLVAKTFEILAEIIGFVWNYIIQPVLNLFLEVAKIVFNAIAAIITDIVIPILQNLGDFFGWIWNTLIQPVLEALKNKFTEVSDWIKNVIEQHIKPNLEGLKDKFSSVVDGIKGIWEGLKKVFAAPIRFLLETVINDGIIKGWNWVDDKLDGKLGELTPVALPPSLNFATGGVLPGYTPGKDVHHFVSPTGGRLNLSGGEAIMRPEWTRAVGGPAAVEQMNKAARTGKLTPVEKHSSAQSARNHALGGVVQSFANGGIIGAMMDIVSRKYPMLTMSSGYRPGDSGNHGAGRATDWSNGSGNTPQQLALAQDIAETYPGSAELIYDSPGWSGNIKNGQNVGAFGQFYTMAQAGPHHHHVHWAMNTPPTMPFGGGVFEGGSGGGGASFNPLRSLFSAAVDKIFKPIREKFDSFGGGIAKTLPIVGEKVIGASVDYLMDKLPFSGGVSGSNIDIGEVNGTNREMGKQAADNVGWTQHWNSLDSLIMGESGWNNTAQNPTSTAYGIFQFLDSTWGNYGFQKTSDPATQIKAGFKYIQDRYGDPSKAYNFWLAQNPHWYDQGGEAAGTGFMAKNVIKPERVLSPAQTEGFNDFVYRFLPEMIRSFKENPSDLRKGFSDVVYAITLGNVSLEKMREEQITNMATALKDVFRSKEKGRGGSLRDIFGPFGGAGVAGSMLGMAILDPEGYLEAEEQAIEMAEEEAAAEAEAAKKAEQEEQRKKEEAERAKEEAERKAAEEARKKEEAEKEAAEKEAAESEEDPLATDGEEPVDVKVVDDESDTETDTDEPVEVEVADTEGDSAEETPEVEVDTDTSDTVDSDEAVVPSTSSDSADTVNIDADTVNVNGATATEDVSVAVEEDSPEEDTQTETPDALPSDLEEATETGDVEEVEPVSTEPVEAVVVDDESKDAAEVDPAEAVAEAADVQVDATEEVSDEEKAAIEARKQADEEAARKREQEEQDEIRKKKESGEYYYGFEVLNKDGSNPNEYEASESEKLFRSTLVSLSGPTGFSSLVSKVDEKFTVAQSLASGIMTAIPAWTSAIGGVGSAIATGNFAQLPAAVAGLSHNIAAASASALAQTGKEAMELVPSAITGVAEMMISSSALNSQQAPFIENVNAGMTQGELMQTLSHYDMMRSRRGGGTPRMRG